MATLTAAVPPAIDRVRYDVRARRLEVAQVEQVSPAMLRVTMTSDDLADFESRGFDDHVKLLFPSGGTTERRDYTPRRFDRAARTLAIDFALHDAGPATAWVRQARPGDRLDVAGPKGSRVVSPAVRRWLLVGDETALPAIGRFIEEVRPDTSLTCLVAIAGAGNEQTFVTAGDRTIHSVHRHRAMATDPAPLLAVLNRLAIEPNTFFWIAAEDTVARALRERLIAGDHPVGWMRAASYWIAGRVDAHLKPGPGESTSRAGFGSTAADRRAAANVRYPLFPAL